MRRRPESSLRHELPAPATAGGGAKSFEVSLDPRAVIVSSDAVHCSKTPSEVSVTYIGPLKK